MSLGDITSRGAVLKAIDLSRKWDVTTFFGTTDSRARAYFLTYEGQDYDSKAILAVAHAFQFPVKGPLEYHQFHGGKGAVKPKLESLGFMVQAR